MILDIYSNNLLIVTPNVNPIPHRFDGALECPKHCEYASGPCDQELANLPLLDGFFIYASQPTEIKNTIAEAVKNLQKDTDSLNYKSWENLNISGRTIFCEICKAIRSAKMVIGDITTLNFNVVFELGYAFGLDKEIVPIRDTTFQRDQKLFDALTTFDTIGYQDFRNSADVVTIVTSSEGQSRPHLNHNTTTLNRKQPIFCVKSPHDTDASKILFSALERFQLSFRAYDSRHTPRFPLKKAISETMSSQAVIGHLIDPARAGATVHNARVAFVCGMAMAAQKYVLILQQDGNSQPIDYRDVVVLYRNHDEIPAHVEKLVGATSAALRPRSKTRIIRPNQNRDPKENVIPENKSRQNAIDIDSGEHTIGIMGKARQGEMIVPLPSTQQSPYNGLLSASTGTGRVEAFQAIRERAKEKIIVVGIGMSQITSYAQESLARQAATVSLEFLMIDPRYLENNEVFAKELQGFLGIRDFFQVANSSFKFLSEFVMNCNQSSNRSHEFRVYSTIPTMSMVLIDPETPNGELVIEFFLYKSGVYRPRFHIKKTGHPNDLFSHFYGEYRRVWNSASTRKVV